MEDKQRETGENDTFDNIVQEETPEITEPESPLPLYGIILIAVFGVILLVSTITVIIVIRTRRRATGRYSPNKHEKTATRETTLEVWRSIQSPEPERLI